jgi:hypothetical protein
MSIKSIKTASYDGVIDEFLWGLDLYDRNNRNTRLKEKRSCDSKQDIYIEGLNERIISSFCSSEENGDGKKLINDILDFSEDAATFIFAKPVITNLSNGQIYQRYIKYILCPLLTIYIDMLRKSHDSHPFVIHLHKLLLSISDGNIAYASRKMLYEIINKPECELYRAELIENIRGIRNDRAQRRDTINQRIRLAISSFDHISDPDEKDKCLRPLIALQNAFYACMAIINFDIKTALGGELSRQYKNTVASTSIRNESIRSDISPSFLSQLTGKSFISKSTESHLTNLWKRATRTTQANMSKPAKNNIDTLFYLLGHSECNMRKTKKYSPSNDFIIDVATKDNLSYLKPYTFMLNVLNCIEENKLQDAISLLDSGEAIQIENTIGLPYYAAILFIGLTIKTAQSQIKHESLNPLIQIIINTQPLYAEYGTSMLKSEPDLFTSNPYSQTLLRSIKKYNYIIQSRVCPSIENPPQAILDMWDGVEKELLAIQNAMIGVINEQTEQKLAGMFNQSDKSKSLITYLPDSTLYNCVRGLEEFKCQSLISKEKHPATFQILGDVEYRKNLLKAIDPEQYELDSKTDCT